MQNVPGQLRIMLIISAALANQIKIPGFTPKLNIHIFSTFEYRFTLIRGFFFIQSRQNTKQQTGGTGGVQSLEERQQIDTKHQKKKKKVSNASNA